MIAALVSTVLMSVGAYATSLDLHPIFAVAAFGIALVVLIARPWRDVVVADRTMWRLAALATLLAVPSVLGLLTGGLRYHSDAVVAAHAAAERALAGRHPYEGFDLVAELARFGLPPEYATPLEDGTRLRTLQYPALTFLVPAPFIALGLADVRALYLIEVLAIFALVLWRTRWHPLALACCVGNVAVIDQFVNAGVDPLWALLVLVAWLTRPRRWSAVVLGFAIATRQPAWLIAPFVIAWAWRALGWREALARAGIAIAVALAVHLPFLATALPATVAGIVTPALLPLEPWGVGPAKLLADTVGPVVTRAVFLVVAGTGYLAALWAFASGRAIRGALVLPLLPLWLSWRALQSYFAFLPLFALVEENGGDARR